MSGGPVAPAHGRRRTWAPVAALAFLLAVATPAVADAAQITVTGTDDEISQNGACSLREAVIAANTDSATADCPAGSGADTIVLPAGRYRLFLPGTEDAGSAGSVMPQIKDLDVTGELTIQGAGPDATIIDANELDRAIDAYAPLTVADLSIVHGRTQDSGRYEYNAGDGAAIRSDRALVVEDCVFAGNHAAEGLDSPPTAGKEGAILTAGEGGRAGADGGAIYAEGPLTVSDSRFEGNSAGSGGDGGSATGGKPTNRSKSEINGGGAFGGLGGRGGEGGAIWARAGLTVTDTTFREDLSGAGGMGGSATGGEGGGFYESSTNQIFGGDGGNALGGNGGDGGDGGAVYVAAGTAAVTSSRFEADTGGLGGTGGVGNGGAGAPAAGARAGSGFGGPGGAGGSGAAIASAQDAGVLTIDAATMDGDSGGPGGTGGAGNGSGAESSLFGEDLPGNGTGGAGGPGGGGGAGAFESGARLTNVTVDGGSAGSGGSGGIGTAGQILKPVAPSPQGTGGGGGVGGAGGAVLSTGPETEIRSSTLTATGSGPGGAGGGGSTQAGAAGAAGSGSTLASFSGRIGIGASILEPGPGGKGCSGTIGDRGGNIDLAALAGDTSCPGQAADPGLGDLTDNGGPVPTRRPAPGGPAIDRAPAADCPPTDARFVDRPFGAGCDIGAYEVAAPVASTGGATNVGQSAGTVSAVVDPQAAGGAVHFDYGTSTSYGSSTPAQALRPAAEEIGVAAPITGLPAGTVVHYRVSIVTPDGAAVGADRTFTTGGSSGYPGKVAAPRKQLCTVPSLKGKKLKVAKKRIGARHCHLGKVKKRGDATAKSGKVVRQAPKAGAQVPEGTKVKVTIAKPKRGPKH